MSKFWLILLKNGIKAIVNALDERDAKEHVKRELAQEDNQVDSCVECDKDGKVIKVKK